jgi:hypothetical protein
VTTLAIPEVDASLKRALGTVARKSRGGGSGDPPRVITIDYIIDNGSNVITTGAKFALRVGFPFWIVGAYIQEADGVTGSVTMNLETSDGGATPTWTTINGATALSITTGRYYENVTLTGWTRRIQRTAGVAGSGVWLRANIATISSFKRLTVALDVLKLRASS